MNPNNPDGIGRPSKPQQTLDELEMIFMKAMIGDRPIEFNEPGRKRYEAAKAAIYSLLASETKSVIDKFGDDHKIFEAVPLTTIKQLFGGGE